MKTTLLVLAAGMGSRYGGLKQIDPVGPSGEVVLDYSVHDALWAGFDRIVFVIRRDFEEAFRDVVLSRYAGVAEVVLAYQELDDLPAGISLPEGREKPWGTGHAIWCARDVIDGPFLVVNADDFYGMEAFSVMATFLKSKAAQTSFAMVAYPIRNTLSEHGAVSRGICTVGDNDTLLDVEECSGIHVTASGDLVGTDATGNLRTFQGEEMVSMNFWGFTPDLFGMLGDQFANFLNSGGLANLKSEFYIPTAVTNVIESGIKPVLVKHSNGRWFGVTYREDRDAVAGTISAMVAQGLYKTPLWNHTA